jgi:hypothetical protein
MGSGQQQQGVRGRAILTGEMSHIGHALHYGDGMVPKAEGVHWNEFQKTASPHLLLPCTMCHVVAVAVVVAFNPYP